MKKGVFVSAVMMVFLFTLAIGLTEAQAALPDLKVTSLTVQAYTAAKSRIKITDVTKNRGAADAGASFTKYYLSSTPTLVGAQQLGRRYVPPLIAGAKNTGSTYVTIPNVGAGTYYIIAKADATKYVTESKEGNNKRVTSITIYSSSDKPDLEISALSAPASADPGDDISINDTTENSGLAAVLQTVTVFYLSADSVFDVEDVRLGDRIIPSLSAGANSSGTTEVTIPPETAAGSYYILAVADAANIVYESDEGNNSMSTAITIGP